MNIRTLIATAALALTGAAFAQAPAPAPKDPAATPGIDQRAANQEKRIEKGVASGQLTGREAARLEKREGKIAADTAAAKADGKVTRAERKQLHAEQNHASKAIHRQKHDAQTAAPAAAK